MAKRLSEQLSDLSVRAKSAEQALDAAEKEADEKIAARKEQAHAAATTGGLQPAERERGNCRILAPLRHTAPIAEAISKEAQPRYNHPFKFFIVHESHPNAFPTPGGNVYVVDSF